MQEGSELFVRGVHLGEVVELFFAHHHVELLQGLVYLPQWLEATTHVSELLLRLATRCDLLTKLIQIDGRILKLRASVFEGREDLVQLRSAILIQQPCELALHQRAVSDQRVLQGVAIDAHEVDVVSGRLAADLQTLRLVSSDVVVELAGVVAGLGVLADEGLLVHLPQSLVLVPVRQVLLKLGGGGGHTIHDLHHDAQDVRVVADDVVVGLDLLLAAAATRLVWVQADGGRDQALRLQQVRALELLPPHTRNSGDHTYDLLGHDVDAVGQVDHGGVIHHPTQLQQDSDGKQRLRLGLGVSIDGARQLL